MFEFTLFWALYGETPASPPTEQKPQPPPTEKMIPETEWQKMLEEERKRVREETTATIEKEYSRKIIPAETLKVLGINSHDELLNFITEAVEEVDDRKKTGNKTEKTEEVAALEARFQAEIGQKDAQIEKLTNESATIQSELERERIDTALLYELEKHRAMSPDILTLKLRGRVKLNSQRQPIVVNEQGEPRVKTVEYVQDGVKRFRTEDMTIGDLVTEFLNAKENQHFLPASPKEGSGGRGGQPLDRNVARDADYRAKMEEAVKKGQGATEEFLKLWQEKYKK
jgi:hypothetical protein